jgi:hypothetical protein
MPSSRYARKSKCDLRISLSTLILHRTHSVHPAIIHKAMQTTKHVFQTLKNKRVSKPRKKADRTLNTACFYKSQNNQEKFDHQRMEVRGGQNPSLWNGKKSLLHCPTQHCLAYAHVPPPPPFPKRRETSFCFC